jgi:tetratricopeptide (TPR) repeat protein
VLSAALGLVVTTPAPTFAGPSMWARAHDPPASGPIPELPADDVHRRVIELEREAALDQLGPLGELGRGAAEGKLQAARMLLLRHHARLARDVRLAFDLGHVEFSLGSYESSAETLRSALLRAPEHPLATDAYFTLGVAEAHLGDHVREEQAYLAFLAREDGDGSRLVALGNLAESRMAQGHLAEAEEADRAALAIDGEFFEARWSLAVILDRAGDRNAAITEAARAVAYDVELKMLDNDRVFFVPDYDRYWYLALGHLGRAERLASLAPISARTAVDTLAVGGRRYEETAAMLAYRAYVDAAPKSDRWRSTAADRVAQLEALLGLGAKKPRSAGAGGAPRPR